MKKYGEYTLKNIKLENRLSIHPHLLIRKVNAGVCICAQKSSLFINGLTIRDGNYIIEIMCFNSGEGERTI